MINFDFDEHIRLQQRLTRETLASKPEAVTKYEILARQSGNKMQLQMNITEMRLTFTETEAKAWRMASDFEHA